MSLSLTVSEINGDFGGKSQSHIVHTHLYLTTIRSSPWSFVMKVALKNRVMPLPDNGNGNGKSLTICAFVKIQYQSVTDRQTDRRTDRQTELLT